MENIQKNNGNGKLGYDLKFVIICTIPLVSIIVISTILHHFFPEILQVPNIRGPYLMENVLLDLIIMDIGSLFIAFLVIFHGIKAEKEGVFKLTCFLYGSIIFTGLEECFWILFGRYKLIPFQTYFFTKGGLWFFEIPLYTCLGWFFLAWSCIYVSKILFPKRNYVFHAIIGGFLAVSLDLFIDPVMVNLGSASVFPDSMGMWVWLTDPNTSLSIFSIPFFNFFGWFLVIALFAILYGYIMQDEKIKERGKTQSAFLFYGLIPVFLGICIGLIFIVSMIINPLFAGINIIPIGLM
ncbi:MAG: carotenoid biosynthesis protein [Promethearchaeota archaeon]